MSKITLQQVNLTTLKLLLNNFHFSNIPLYMWGRPSTGKTSIVRQFAKEEAKRRGLIYSEDKFDWHLFTMKVITLSQFDSPDLRGMPYVEVPEKRIEDNGEQIIKKDMSKAVTTFVPTNELPRKGQGILFFDEMNKADETTVAACYQIILEGRYGSLPPVHQAELENVKVGSKDGKDIYEKRAKKDKAGNIIFKKDKDGDDIPAFWRLAASNTENDFSNVNTSSLALLRRFSHLSVMPESGEVTAYFAKKGLDPRVTAFLSNSPEDLFPQKYDEKLVENKANPFPSTWENLAHMIEAVHITSSMSQKEMSVVDNQIFHLAASCVGAPLASKFISYVRMVSKIDLAEIIKHPKEGLSKIKKDDNRASLLYSIVYSLGYSWNKKERHLKGAKMVEITENLPPEFAASFLKTILETRTRELTQLPGFDKLLTSLGKYFDL